MDLCTITKCTHCGHRKAVNGPLCAVCKPPTGEQVAGAMLDQAEGAKAYREARGQRVLQHYVGIPIAPAIVMREGEGIFVRGLSGVEALEARPTRPVWLSNAWAFAKGALGVLVAAGVVYGVRSAWLWLESLG